MCVCQKYTIAYILTFGEEAVLFILANQVFREYRQPN